MRHLVASAAVVALLLSAAVSARAEDKADAKALLEQAFKAHGGTDNLAKVKAGTVTGKGKFYGMGEDGIDYTLSIAFQSPDKEQMTVEGQGFKVIHVLNKDKGWYAINGNVTELDKEGVQEAKEAFHTKALTQLRPSAFKQAKLEAIGEVKINDKPALGVRVEVKGYRDVTLFFDKETHLLVKCERRAKDVVAGGEEFGEETFYSDYKEVGGVKMAHKYLIKRDGKKQVEGETTEFKAADKIDDAQFAKP